MTYALVGLAFALCYSVTGFLQDWDEAVCADPDAPTGDQP